MYLLTDFLAGVLFILFLDGLIYKRRWQSVVVGGVCLFGATLTRPTFNYFPVLIPAVGYLAGRILIEGPDLADRVLLPLRRRRGGGFDGL